MKTNLIYTR